MAVYPKVRRQCPYKSALAGAMDGDICRICDHRVIDLTDWTDGERVAFAANQKEDVCISYRVPLRPALAAAALAAAALPAMAAAQEAAPPSAAEAPAQAPEPESNEIVGIFVAIGGIGDPANTELVSDAELAAIPEAPVTYEDKAAPEPPPAKPKS
jgi:hypothetical protein